VDSQDVEVSIVVPTYGQSTGLVRLLESLEMMDAPPPFEVVVVDDCSPDDTEAVARQWLGEAHGFPTEYVKLEENSGPATARNAGTKKARGRVVVYTDSDCRVERGWLRKLVRKLDPEGGIVGVGGSVLPVNPSGFFSKYNSVNHILEPLDSLVYLVTANCCFIRERVLEVDGFDEDVRNPGGEDVAISIKMFRKGWRFAFDSEAVVYHDYREGIRDFFRTWRNYAYGCGYVIGKYFEETASVDPTAAWHRNTIRPPLMTPRLTAFVLGIEYDECQKARVGRMQTVAFVLLRYFQMYVHYWYFRKGEVVFTGRKPFRVRCAALCRLVLHAFKR